MGRPKRKRLGQNFLVDEGVARRVVSMLDDDPPRVLEIGPGKGALTGLLQERFGRILALELDRGLIPGLESRFKGSGVEVVQCDALHDPLDGLLGPESPWQAASNLPFSVGTAILRRLLPRHDLFVKLVVMLQREVAERFVARPGDKNHALLALEGAAWADARIAFDIPPKAFRPRPKVMSSVVVLNLHEAPMDRARLDGGLRLAAHALTKPRKMLSNALRPFAGTDLILAADLDPRVRPAALSLDDWARLARMIRNR